MASNDGSVLERISKNNVLFSACHSVVNGLFCNLFIVHSFSPQIVTEQLWCTERSSRLCDHLWPSPIVAPLSSVNHNPTTRSIHIRAPLCFFCSHPSPGLHLLPSRSLPRSLIFTTPIYFSHLSSVQIWLCYSFAENSPLPSGSNPTSFAL